jgi:fructose-1,6-bisphosphatase
MNTAIRLNEIKNIMIVFGDSDFRRPFDWVGKVALMTLLNPVNICGCNILEESDDIEKFIISLLPTAIDFIQYRESKFARYPRYEAIPVEERDYLVNYLTERLIFKYNVDETDDKWFEDSGSLVIDLEGQKSFLL